MKQTLVRLMLVASLALTGTISAPAQSAQAFTGHRCTISTCRFFTSSYYSARYYYDRRTCGQWKSLSRTYLQGFNTKAALLNKYPTRKLHPPC
jgi:hypothetical protein